MEGRREDGIKQCTVQAPRHRERSTDHTSKST